MNRRILARRIQRFLSSREGLARLAFLGAVVAVCWLNPQVAVVGVIVGVAASMFYWLR